MHSWTNEKNQVREKPQTVHSSPKNVSRTSTISPQNLQCSFFWGVKRTARLNGHSLTSCISFVFDERFRIRNRKDFCNLFIFVSVSGPPDFILSQYFLKRAKVGAFSGALLQTHHTKPDSFLKMSRNVFPFCLPNVIFMFP